MQRSPAPPCGNVQALEGERPAVRRVRGAHDDVEGRVRKRSVVDDHQFESRAWLRVAGPLEPIHELLTGPAERDADAEDGELVHGPRLQISRDGQCPMRLRLPRSV